MDNREEKLNMDNITPADDSFTLEDIISEFGGEETAPLEDFPESEEDIGRSIGDVVSGALAEQEQEKAAYKRELDSVRRKNRREQQRSEKLKKSREQAVERLEKAEKKVAERAAAQSRPAQPKVVTLQTGQDRAPVNDTGRKKVKKVKLQAVPKREKTAEPSAAEAFETYKKGYVSMRIRCVLALAACIVMCVLSIGQAFRLWSPEKNMTCMILAGLQVFTAIICADGLINNLKPAGKVRFGLALVVAVENVLTLVDAITFLILQRTLKYTPCCAVSAVMMTMLLWSHAMGKSAGAKTVKTIVSGVKRSVLTVEDKLYMGNSVAVKSGREPDGFVSMCTGEDSGRKIVDTVACIVYLAATAVSVAVSVMGGAWDEFIHVWSCVLCASLPFSAAVTYTLPFSKLTKRLRREGAALGGYRGAARLAKTHYLNITDRELFAPRSVSLNGIKIVGEPCTVAYTAAMMAESGCCLAPAFESLAREQFRSGYKVDGFRMLEGGMEGRIRGEYVVCGTAEFMHVNGIELPKGTHVTSAVFTAIDGELSGIFAITYKASEKVGDALDMLLESDVRALFTTRDFNMTREMIQKTFDVDAVDMEIPYVDNSERIMRCDIGGVPAAVMTKEGGSPMVYAVLGARKLMQVVRGNIILAVLGSAVGMALAAYLALTGEIGVLIPGNILAFMILWFIPAIFCSGGVTKF